MAESAVIGYPHEIKGEGKMLSFLPQNIPWGYGTVVGSGTGSNAAGISAQASQSAPAPHTAWALHKVAAAVPLCGQKLLSTPRGYQQRTLLALGPGRVSGAWYVPCL